MNNKKKLLIAVALLLVAAFSSSITVAWFTDQQEVSNVATIGGVDVELTEEVKDPSAVEDAEDNPDYDPTKDPSPTNPEKVVPDPENPSHDTPLLPGEPTKDPEGNPTGADYGSVTPGCSYIKAPTVENLEEDALVRLVVTRSWTPKKEGVTLDISKILLHLVNTGDWVYKTEDGVDYFYYTKVLPKKTSAGTFKTSAPFDYFTISSNVGNDYNGAKAEIAIRVDAVQAAGLGTSAVDVADAVWATVVPVE